MNREEQAQLCALLAKLRFELARFSVVRSKSNSSSKDFNTEIDMINRIMSICILPETVKVK